MRFPGLALLVCVVVCLSFLPARGEAAVILDPTINVHEKQLGVLDNELADFGGTFINDNDVALIYFSIDATSEFSVQITSQSSGGFDPYLSLFGLASGQYEYLGFDTDTGLPEELSAGFYLLALTQYDNRYNPIQGFDYQTDPSFTLTLADIFKIPVETDCEGFAALDFSAGTSDCRTGAFGGTVTVRSVVPEPGTLSLLAVGAAVVVARHRRRNRSSGYRT